ncbi:1,2-phenylacetyl-CoA epoxidase subunit PaaE [Modicisalibacter sp. 'Wilcox']|uniref:1,2-phenylacetyl-CoA epoxidase subunit PaaE n=1 Tax=Modicisalibacter sp. 'Wilcox' TaxID=2679914 RepID=UPI0013D71F1E|nr:1,2-phenylacetyl-CoA epoxidase subunit PaaE [Modicisalibacter sp. 'Wilcox']
MSRFHTLTVQDVRQETRDAVSIAFAIPDELKDTFRFTQGQYLTLRREIDGEEIRRSYSICTGTLDNEIRVAVKRVPEGRFSTFANQSLAVGDTLEVMPPQGRFHTSLDPARQGHYLAVAAGSGITPILSIIATTLEVEPRSRFTLLYGNRSTAGTLFRDRLQGLKDRYLERLNLVYIFSREEQEIDLYNGRIDAGKCHALFDRWVDVKGLEAAFLCGPLEMTEQARDALKAHGLAGERIHRELFGTTLPTAGSRPRQATGVGQVDVDQARVEVMIDGRRLAFEMPRDGESILEAGNAHGAELPFSCQAGVCSTCLAKVEEGEVEMYANYALEDYEIEAGLVLSCQCRPVSDTVILNFDH